MKMLSVIFSVTSLVLTALTISFIVLAKDINEFISISITWVIVTLLYIIFVNVISRTLVLKNKKESSNFEY